MHTNIMQVTVNYLLTAQQNEVFNELRCLADVTHTLTVENPNSN